MSSDEILQHATSPTDQWSADTASQTALQHEDGYSLDGAIPGLQEASVALYSGSPKGGADAANPRAQSGLHSQDSLKLGSCFKTDGAVDRQSLSVLITRAPEAFLQKKRRHC